MPEELPMMPAALIYVLSNDETRTALKQAAQRHAALDAARTERQGRHRRRRSLRG